MRCETGTSVTALRKNWKRWTDIVAEFSARPNARSNLKDREYLALHAALVEGSQAQATQCEKQDRDSVLFLEMTSILQPWNSLQTLDQAGHRLLVPLARRCREIHRTLGGRNYCLRGSRRTALIVAAMFFVGVAACFAADNRSAAWVGTVLQDGQTGADRLAYVLQPVSWAKRFGAIVVAVVVAIQFIRTSTRAR